MLASDNSKESECVSDDEHSTMRSRFPMIERVPLPCVDIFEAMSAFDVPINWSWLCLVSKDVLGLEWKSNFINYS